MSTQPSSPVVGVDTETISLARTRWPWEVGLVRRDEHGERELQFFVDIPLHNADLKALEIGGFYTRHPAGRYLSGGTPSEPTYGDPPKAGENGRLLTPRDAAVTIARWTHDAVLVGINPGFDTDGFEKLLHRQKLTGAWHYTPVCVKSLALGWLLGTGIELQAWELSSDKMAVECGVDLPTDEDRHTALGDARFALRWYDHLVGAR
jgi:hypothetical protein